MHKNKKANLLQVGIIMLRTVWVTFYACMTVLIKTTFSRISRAEINQIKSTWAHRMLNIVKVNIRIDDPYHFENVPGRTHIIMSNHISHYDIPAILEAFPASASIRMIAKKELFRIPVWGAALLKAEFIPIDRNDRKQAFKDLEKAKERMQTGIIAWVAPEGTRSRTGLMQTFKKGGFMLALQTDAIIIPVGLKGTNKILPPDTWDFTYGADVTVSIGKPIDTLLYKTKRNELILEVEKSIRVAAGQQIE